MKKSATIKDIARLCGISPTVASAALRNKKGSVRFSKELREKILKTAKKLDYRQNRLASAMASGKSPFVAVFLHQGNVDFTSINYYLYDVLSAVAFTLHKSGYEMVFVPYSDENEQFERLKSMVEGRLVSGVITNFIADKNKDVFNLLNSSRIPHMVLGNTDNKKVYMSFINKDIIDSKLDDFRRSRGFKDKLVLELRGNSLFSTNGDNQLIPMDWGQVSKRDDVLFCSMGSEFTKLLVEERKLNPEKIITVEDHRSLSAHRPLMLVRQPMHERAELAASLITQWIDSGIPPKDKVNINYVNEEDIKILQ